MKKAGHAKHIRLFHTQEDSAPYGFITPASSINFSSPLSFNSNCRGISKQASPQSHLPADYSNAVANNPIRTAKRSQTLVGWYAWICSNIFGIG